MIPQILFWLAIAAIGVDVIGMTGKGIELKASFIAFPFMLFAAAAVAKYLGY